MHREVRNLTESRLLSLSGSDPLLSLQLICHLSLYHDIFSPPPSAQDSSPLPADAPEQALKGCEISKQILDGTLVIPENLRKALNNPLARRRLWLALYLRPLRGLTFVEKKKQLPLTDATIRYSVKVRDVRDSRAKSRITSLTWLRVSSCPEEIVPLCNTFTTLA